MASLNKKRTECASAKQHPPKGSIQATRTGGYEARPVAQAPKTHKAPTAKPALATEMEMEKKDMQIIRMRYILKQAQEQLCNEKASVKKELFAVSQFLQKSTVAITDKLAGTETLNTEGFLSESTFSFLEQLYFLASDPEMLSALKNSTTMREDLKSSLQNSPEMFLIKLKDLLDHSNKENQN